VITHLLIGWYTYPKFLELELLSWIAGPVALLLTGIALYLTWRFRSLYQPIYDQIQSSKWDRFMSFDWLYRFFWRSFRTLLRVFSLVSSILEGDGGLLWALVLFGLIFVFLQR
jgi:hypothetical protein